MVNWKETGLTKVQENAVISAYLSENEVAPFMAQLNSLELSNAEGIGYLAITKEEGFKNLSLKKFAGLVKKNGSSYHDVISYLVTEMDIPPESLPNDKESVEIYALAEQSPQIFLSLIRLGAKKYSIHEEEKSFINYPKLIKEVEIMKETRNKSLLEVIQHLSEEGLSLDESEHTDWIEEEPSPQNEDHESEDDIYVDDEDLDDPADEEF